MMVAICISIPVELGGTPGGPMGRPNILDVGFDET